MSLDFRVLVRIVFNTKIYIFFDYLFNVLKTLLSKNLYTITHGKWIYQSYQNNYADKKKVYTDQKNIKIIIGIK